MRQLLVASLMLLLSACQSNPKMKSAPEKTDADAPKLTKPVVRKIWVSPQIEDDGKVFRDGHFKYLLERESVWSR